MPIRFGNRSKSSACSIPFKLWNYLTLTLKVVQKLTLREMLLGRFLCSKIVTQKQWEITQWRQVKSTNKRKNSDWHIVCFTITWQGFLTLSQQLISAYFKFHDWLVSIANAKSNKLLNHWQTLLFKPLTIVEKRIDLGKKPSILQIHKISLYETNQSLLIDYNNYWVFDKNKNYAL